MSPFYFLFKNNGFLGLKNQAGLYGLWFLSVIAVIYFMDVKKEIVILKNAQHHEQELNVLLQETKLSTKAISIAQEKLNVTQLAWQKILTQQPQSTRRINLWDYIVEMAKISGLKIMLFEPKPVIRGSFYINSPLRIILSGNYDQIMSFIKTVAQSEKMIVLENFTLNLAQEAKKDSLVQEDKLSITADLNCIEYMADHTIEDNSQLTSSSIATSHDRKNIFFKSNEKETIPNRHSLTDYPLNVFSMLGTLSDGQRIWAIVRTPDNQIYRAQVGQKIGNHNGYITAINSTAIKVSETNVDNNTRVNQEIKRSK